MPTSKHVEVQSQADSSPTKLSGLPIDFSDLSEGETQAPLNRVLLLETIPAPQTGFGGRGGY